MTSLEIAKAAAAHLDEKKALDIVALKVDHLTIVADYFVIASASSNTAVRALADYVDEKMEEQGVKLLRSEGVKEGRWAALDFGSVIVHVFYTETRQIYQLEKLWADGTNLVVPLLASAQ